VIKLTGLDKREIVLNADHIEKIEEVPESVITLSNGKKYLVHESMDEIINRIIIFKRKIYIGNLKDI